MDSATTTDGLQISIKCKVCKRDIEVPVTDDQYERIDDCLNNGAYDGMISRAVPDLEPKWREMFISGFCPECFEKVFPAFDGLSGNEG